nr:hypothetical protein [Tanacetum cinerariifolium]
MGDVNVSLNLEDHSKGIKVLREFKEATGDEEKLLKQKTKVSWLKERDKNSTYFHKVLKGRLNKNRIMSMCAKDEVTKIKDDDGALFVRRISMEEATLMTREIQDDEIKKALFGIDDNKALGPDGLDDDTRSKINSIFPFKEGKLLERYLGAPLVTKKIGVADFLGSMQVYEGSVFFLPKTVVNDIKKLFKSFLWNSGDSCKGKAKVAWKEVCKPKDQGGLGFKPLELWNKTLLVKHLWNVASRKESFWVKWINVVKLKKRSVWDVSVDSKDSWGWKCLLNFRSWIGDHMRYRVRDGNIINVWHDKWHEGLSLSSLFSKNEIFYVGFKDHDKINPDKAIWIDSSGSERNSLLTLFGKMDKNELFSLMCDDLRAKMVSITLKNSMNVD